MQHRPPHTTRGRAVEELAPSAPEPRCPRPFTSLLPTREQSNTGTEQHWNSATREQSNTPHNESLKPSALEQVPLTTLAVCRVTRGHKDSTPTRRDVILGKESHDGPLAGTILVTKNDPNHSEPARRREKIMSITYIYHKLLRSADSNSRQIVASADLPRASVV